MIVWGILIPSRRKFIRPPFIPSLLLTIAVTLFPSSISPKKKYNRSIPMKGKKIPSAGRREPFPLQQIWEQKGLRYRDEPKKMLGKEKESKCK
jgi:hypothetical protein